MRRFWLVMFLASTIAGATLCAFIRNPGPRRIEPHIKYTTNQAQDWMLKFFQRAGSTLSIDNTGAHFQMAHNGRGFCLGDPDDPTTLQHMTFVSQFTLSKPGEIFWSPDHHGSAIFTVKQIAPEGLVLSYRTEFDSRSFGKNVISIDEGEIKLEPFQSQSVPETE